MIFLQFLGWRIGTIARLETAKLRVLEDSITVEASHCKNSAWTSMPCNKISFTRMPRLYEATRNFILEKQAQGDRLLFDIPSRGNLS